MQSVPSAMAIVNVLVVDDDIAASIVLKRMIESLGMSCDIARDGAEAVEACSTKEYHIVLMDIFMPIKNGFVAAVEIRKNSTERTRPSIIGMVSIDDVATRWQCRDCGMVDVLCKPVSRINLRQSIASKQSFTGEKSALSNLFNDKC